MMNMYSLLFRKPFGFPVYITEIDISAIHQNQITTYQTYLQK